MDKNRINAQVEFEVSKVKRKFTRIYIISILSCLIAGFAAGYAIIKSQYSKYDDPNIQKFVDIYNIMVDEWYYGEDDFEEDILDDAIDSFVNQEDPYTFYTSKDESQNLTVNQKGLGFRYMYYGGNFYITYVYKNSDAEAKGLKEGDVIVASKVEGEWKVLDDLTYEEACEALVASKEEMTYRLANSSEITFKRSDYLLSGVRLIHSGVENNRLHVGIKIDTFLDENLSNKVDQILKDCLKEHNKTAIGQLTIDLRGNGGGFVDEAINLASLFVEKGSTIIKYRYKDGSEKSFKTTTSRKYEIPQLYILQDHSSASASESFTLAMQDLSTDKLLNTKVIGTKSYGKGLVQSVKYFNDGSALRYTIAETLSPNGRSINKVGIVPDVDISYPFYYFGEQEQLNQSTKDFIVKSINFIMNEEYDLFNEAILSFKEQNGLTLNEEFDIETAKLIQKMAYDKYVEINYSYLHELKYI
jgi:carboxyl-terminal processing protease